MRSRPGIQRALTSNSDQVAQLGGIFPPNSPNRARFEMFSFLFGVIAGFWMASRCERLRSMAADGYKFLGEWWGEVSPFVPRYEIVKVRGLFSIRKKSPLWFLDTYYNISRWEQDGGSSDSWFTDPSSECVLRSLETCRRVMRDQPWVQAKIDRTPEVVE